jgi:predicted metal-dependent hydrolase
MKIKIDKIIRSKRKSIALEIGRDARLIVRAPLRANLKFIEAIVRSKANWISQKQLQFKEKYSFVKDKKFILDEEFLYLGNLYKLKYRESHVALDLDDHFYLSDKYGNSAKAVFQYWYKERAYEKLLERTVLFANQAGFSFNKIKISNAQGRWGSCSYNGNINFSWRLIMAPLEVLDYVVVHELSHLKHRDHSIRFWNRVASIMPDYKIHRQWLKNNGHLLDI